MMTLFSILLGMACAVDKQTDSVASIDSASEHLTSFVVTGQVVDDIGTPIPRAMVMVGGKAEEHVVSDDSGHFELLYEVQSKGEPAIVAAKDGYRSGFSSQMNPSAFVYDRFLLRTTRITCLWSLAMDFLL